MFSLFKAWSQSSNSNSEIEQYHDEFQDVTAFSRNLLNKCITLSLPNKTSVADIIEKSKAFPLKFPINTCRVETQSEERHSQIEFQINSVRPVLHERALWLYIHFLEYQSKFGNEAEKDFYQNMGICELVQRLLEKRCVKFCDAVDSYMLLNGETGWDLYKNPIPLSNCISYKEIKLSALLSVSSYTEFINIGNRTNCGLIEKDLSKIERDGIIIGLIGARFQRPNEMEYQDVVIEKNQNQKNNGYGFGLNKKNLSEKLSKLPETIFNKIEYRKLWNTFYNEIDFEFEKALNYFKGDKTHRLIFPSHRNSSALFDTLIMKKRFAISFDTLLLEANTRASTIKKQAYIHVVGIGLGVWKFCNEQDDIFLETFGNRLEFLKNELHHIKCINFSWFKNDNCNGIKNNELFKIENHPNGGIKILFSKRNPHEKLNEEFSDCLLIVSYAWDGNALPGNEFWNGGLGNSGDPAAACSTLITELHNPHINQKLCNGNNLYVATFNYGVIHIAEYAKKILELN